MFLFSKSFSFLLLLISASSLSAGEFTISSYNCGGLSDHYDYLRAGAMQKLMQERYASEPEAMALNEKIQQVAIKILFAPDDSQDKLSAQQEWEQKKYQDTFEAITASPDTSDSINKKWNQRVDEIITNYQIRPVKIRDQEVTQMLADHLKDLTQNQKGKRSELLDFTRTLMAQRIFAHQLKFDIICLQEADYLTPSTFLVNYEVLLTDSKHSKNGIAWNKERFKLIEIIGDLFGRAFAVELEEVNSGKTVLVASGHMTGCNPYRQEPNPRTGMSDSTKGDSELQGIIDLFETRTADFKIIGMDSNVTSLHPRLNLLKEAHYALDYSNFLEPTCTNPYQVLNTRIDWIAVKSNEINAKVINIPVMNVGLNHLQTNFSDHKPIAAKIVY